MTAEEGLVTPRALLSVVFFGFFGRSHAELARRALPVSQMEGQAVDEERLVGGRAAHVDDDERVLADRLTGGAVDLVIAVVVGESHNAELASGRDLGGRERLEQRGATDAAHAYEATVVAHGDIGGGQRPEACVVPCAEGLAGRGARARREPRARNHARDKQATHPAPAPCGSVLASARSWRRVW